ncbi:MAG: TetR/AcrR family transcriptional regulator [Spirochaetia bacterium]
MKEGKRQQGKESTRLKLLEAAAALFAEKGISTTTTEHVAARAGVAHGTVFAHFPTQEALLIAVIDDFGTRVAGRLHELVAGSADTSGALAAHLRGLMETEGLYSRLISEAAALPRQARTSLVMMQSTISIHICQIAEKDMAAKKIRRMPVALLFNTWVALLHHYLSNANLFSPGRSVLERRGDELRRHFLSLIRP